MAHLADDILPQDFPFHAEALDSGRAHVLKEKVQSLLIQSDGRIHCHGKSPIVVSGPALIFLPPQTGVSIAPRSRISRLLFRDEFLYSLLSGAGEKVSLPARSLDTAYAVAVSSDVMPGILSTVETIRAEFTQRRRGYQTVIRLNLMELFVLIFVI